MSDDDTDVKSSRLELLTRTRKYSRQKITNICTKFQSDLDSLDNVTRSSNLKRLKELKEEISSYGRKILGSKEC